MTQQMINLDNLDNRVTTKNPSTENHPVVCIFGFGILRLRASERFAKLKSIFYLFDINWILDGNCNRKP